MPVHISQADQLSSASFAVIYDPDYFDLLTVSEGMFFRQEARKTSFTSPARPGAVTVSVSRSVVEPGVSGQGTLALLSFRAKKSGKAIGFTIANVILNQKGGGQQKPLSLGSSVEIR